MNPTEKGLLIARALIARALIARALIARAAMAHGFGGRGNKTGHVIGHVIDCENM
jgi:argininosuccinate synthase